MGGALGPMRLSVIASCVADKKMISVRIEGKATYLVRTSTEYSDGTHDMLSLDQTPPPDPRCMFISSLLSPPLHRKDPPTGTTGGHLMHFTDSTNLDPALPHAAGF